MVVVRLDAGLLGLRAPPGDEWTFLRGLTFEFTGRRRWSGEMRG